MGDWPSYPVGRTESIFALGVASIKYAELESSFVFVFATALDISIDLATRVYARVGREACTQLIGQTFQRFDFIGPETRATADLRFFVEAFQICSLNRDNLVHSTTVPTGETADSIILHKISKQGKTLLSLQELSALHEIADDMHAFHRFGRDLANAINARDPRLAEVPLLSPFSFPWPKRPPLPHKLDYSADPIPV
jgi:hypothetical protein